MTAIPAMQLGPNHKYCPSCACVLDAQASFCVRCGSPQAMPQAAGGGRSRIGAALIAFFLGGFGVHRFYLGQWGWGLVYLLFFWTFIPSIAALVDFIRYLAMSDEEFRHRYGAGGGGGVVFAVVAVAGGCVVVAGILAAIAIPNFIRYQQRSKSAGVAMDVQGLAIVEQTRWMSRGEYAPLDEPLPRGGTLGGEKIAWTDDDLAAAHEIGWNAPSATWGRYRAAVRTDAEGHQAVAICGESDLDGDGAHGAWVAFAPFRSPEGEVLVAPPPAPCSEQVVVAPDRSLEFDPGTTRINVPIPVSPSDVF